MKILCIADSLSLPRPEVPYHCTWPAKLKNSFINYDFITIFKRQLTTDVFVESWEGDTLEFYSPNIVILQLGIVDCAPRYLKQKSYFALFVRILPNVFQNKFWKVYKKYRNRDLKYADVPIEKFTSNLEFYLKRCLQLNVSKIIVIKICTPGACMVDKNPNVIEAVSLYNSVYDRFAEKYPIIELINPLNSGDDDLFVDGYHPNEKGNELVFQDIYQILQCQN